MTAAQRAAVSEPRISVRLRASRPEDRAALAMALKGSAGIWLIDSGTADALVIAVDTPAPEPRLAVGPAAGALNPILLVDGVDRDWVLAAVRAGARAVLPRACGTEALIQVVRTVAAGLIVFHPDLVPTGSYEAGAVFSADADPETGLAEPLESLTERELQVLHLLSDGLSNKAIARRLAISDHTVKFHLASVFSKLGAKSRAEALARGVRFGLVHL